MPRKEPNREKDMPTMLRMRAEDKAALKALSRYLGVSMSDTVVLLVREKVRTERIKVNPLEHYG